LTTAFFILSAMRSALWGDAEWFAAWIARRLALTARRIVFSCCRYHRETWLPAPALSGLTMSLCIVLLLISNLSRHRRISERIQKRKLPMNSRR